MAGFWPSSGAADACRVMLMSLETLVLALASALRPTQLAAVYALLGTPRPRRLLTAYIVAGLAFSLATGIAVVAIVHGAEIREGGDRGTFDGLFELVAGSALLGFAVGLFTGRVQRRSRRETVELRELGHRAPAADPSVTVAATAGIATHLPASSTSWRSTRSSPSRTRSRTRWSR